MVVGVNRFQAADEAPSQILRVDPEVMDRQRARLRRVRAERNAARVAAALAALARSARRDDNLMPPILEAVHAYATIGEICDTPAAHVRCVSAAGRGLTW